MATRKKRGSKSKKKQRTSRKGSNFDQSVINTGKVIITFIFGLGVFFSLIAIGFALKEKQTAVVVYLIASLIGLTLYSVLMYTLLIIADHVIKITRHTSKSASAAEVTAQVLTRVRSKNSES